MNKSKVLFTSDLKNLKYTCEITDGELPSKQRKLVLAWSELHKEELLANWKLASQGEIPFKIEPLK